MVLAVRGDHLGRLAEHPVLAERAADGMLLVPPLTEAELREVVEGPAAVAGLDVGPDLVDAVLREVAGQPAALPLLSTSLVATWERRRDATLTLAGYLELKEFELSTVGGRLYGADGPEPEPVTTAGWNADGSRLFLGTGESLTGKGTRGAVVVVNTTTWRPERRLFEGGGVYALTVSPDGRLIAAGDVTGRVTVADASTYRVVRTLRARDTVRGLAFSPDGSRLAAVGDSKRLDVWDVASGRAVFAQPAYFSGAGTSVQWLPGGHEVVYGGWDGQAVLYDVDRQAVRGVSLPVYRDGGEGQVFVAPTRGDQLALLPGARIGGAVSREGVVYSLRPSDWLAHACDVVGRDLTRAEWAAYVPELPYQATCSQLG